MKAGSFFFKSVYLLHFTCPYMTLWIFYIFSTLCLLCLCAHLFICALWSPAGKGLTSWLLFVASNCEFVTFPLVNLGQVWYLIGLIPDLCTLTYFQFSTCSAMLSVSVVIYYVSS